MKKYNNELKLVENLILNHTNVIKSQNYIKENYNVSSLFDKDLSLLYIWNENNSTEDILKAQEYIKENFDENLLEVDNYKPSNINEDNEEIFVVYLDDNTMYNMYYNEKDADEAIKKLEKESPINKPTKKKEKVSNYVK